MNSRKHHRFNHSLGSAIGGALVAAALALAAIPISTPAQPSCTFTSKTPPGRVYPLFDWQLNSDGTKAGTLPGAFNYTMEFDNVSMAVADGSGLGLTSNQMLVGITHAPGLNDPKELWAWNRVTGSTSFTFTDGNNIGPNFMLITKGSCPGVVDTIVFKKQVRVLGVFPQMWDMYHLDPTNFWRILGGKVVTFTWNSDDANIGNPYPMPCSSPCVPVGKPARLQWDFDGDRRADRVVFQPSTGVWFKLNSQTNLGDTRQLGTSGDVPVAADYDGDGNTDRAIWRPSKSAPFKSPRAARSSPIRSW